MVWPGGTSGFHSGGDTELWKRLGSHKVTLHDEERGEVTGTRFAVWAPNAQAVRLNADFNWWTGDSMSLVPGSGVWATFVEGVGDGALYKYNILGADGVWREKVDPMAFFSRAGAGQLVHRVHQPVRVGR